MLYGATSLQMNFLERFLPPSGRQTQKRWRGGGEGRERGNERKKREKEAREEREKEAREEREKEAREERMWRSGREWLRGSEERRDRKWKRKQVLDRERETMGGTVPRDRNRVCPLETLNATGK